MTDRLTDERVKDLAKKGLWAGHVQSDEVQSLAMEVLAWRTARRSYSDPGAT